MTLLEALVIAIVEGLTEFLPVSSTGHMLIVSALMGVKSTGFVKLYTVAIQLGAILSVVILYRKSFFKSIDFYYKLLVAFIPAAIAGLLFGDIIDSFLENVFGVAVALFVGGLVLFWIDRWIKPSDDHSVPGYKKAFIIGVWQCLALFPGVSRSAATIIGGMTQRLSRHAAAEFSFFLAVPTMFAATAKKCLDIYKDHITITSQEWQLLLMGNVVAFIVAFLAIKGFIGYLTKHGFRGFGVYRILVGALLIVLFLTGILPATI